MRSRKTKTYLEELAKKHNIKVSQMEDIAKAPFKFLAEIISESDREKLEFDSVRIIGLGLFSVKEGRKEFFKEINNDKKHTENRERS